MKTIDVKEEGRVIEVKRSIARIEGFPHCLNGQLVDFSRGQRGMVMGFKEEEVFALILGSRQDVKPGEKVYTREETFRIPVGYGFIGRVVNSLVEPIDGRGPIALKAPSVPKKNTSEEHMMKSPASFSGFYPVFREAPSVLQREPITKTLETGLRSIDAMIPIGKGQRELIIGDRMTGKTSIALDTVLNQKDKKVLCIYCFIGKDYNTLKKVVQALSNAQAFTYTVVVAAFASSSPGEQYLAPYTACTLGEFFMENGEDVFVVFDDLTKHAWAYRQLSLLLERSPGRDAYPGDIFYLHSQLVERASKLNSEHGGGSMTFFPIVDTIQGDITGYVPSNLISMTDGQIYLNTTLFAEGFKPAIDLGLSVSRIGSKVQSKAMKELSAMLRLEYLQYKELLKMSKLKAGLSPEVENKLKRGEAITQILIQEKNKPSSHAEQLLMLYALRKGFLDGLPHDEISAFKKKIYVFACEHNEILMKELTIKRELTPSMKEGLESILKKYFARK